MVRIAKTENGLVRGLPAADPRITAFKGIPFAAPPVYENRWRAPMPCKDWDGNWMLINLSQYQYKTRQGLVMIFTAVNGMWNRILKWMRTACT